MAIAVSVLVIVYGLLAMFTILISSTSNKFQKQEDLRIIYGYRVLMVLSLLIMLSIRINRLPVMSPVKIVEGFIIFLVALKLGINDFGQYLSYRSSKIKT